MRTKFYPFDHAGRAAVPGVEKVFNIWKVSGLSLESGMWLGISNMPSVYTHTYLQTHTELWLNQHCLIYLNIYLALGCGQSHTHIHTYIVVIKSAMLNLSEYIYLAWGCGQSHDLGNRTVSLAFQYTYKGYATFFMRISFPLINTYCSMHLTNMFQQCRGIYIIFIKHGMYTGKSY